MGKIKIGIFAILSFAASVLFSPSVCAAINSKIDPIKQELSKIREDNENFILNRIRNPLDASLFCSIQKTLVHCDYFDESFDGIKVSPTPAYSFRQNQEYFYDWENSLQSSTQDSIWGRIVSRTPIVIQARWLQNLAKNFDKEVQFWETIFYGVMRFPPFSSVWNEYCLIDFKGIIEGYLVKESILQINSQNFPWDEHLFGEVLKYVLTNPLNKFRKLQVSVISSLVGNFFSIGDIKQAVTWLYNNWHQYGLPQNFEQNLNWVIEQFRVYMKSFQVENLPNFLNKNEKGITDVLIRTIINLYQNELEKRFFEDDRAAVLEKIENLIAAEKEKLAKWWEQEPTQEERDARELLSTDRMAARDIENKLPVVVSEIKIACYEYYKRYFKGEVIPLSQEIYRVVKDQLNRISNESDNFWTAGSNAIIKSCRILFQCFEKGTKDDDFEKIFKLYIGDMAKLRDEKDLVEAYKILQQLESSMQYFNTKDKINYNEALLYIWTDTARSHALTAYQYKVIKNFFEGVINALETPWEDNVKSWSLAIIRSYENGFSEDIWESVWEVYKIEVGQKKSSFFSEIWSEFNQINDDIRPQLKKAEKIYKSGRILSELIVQAMTPWTEYEGKCIEEENKLAKKIADEYFRRFWQEAERKKQEKQEELLRLWMLEQQREQERKEAEEIRQREEARRIQIEILKKDREDMLAKVRGLIAAEEKELAEWWDKDLTTEEEELYPFLIKKDKTEDEIDTEIEKNNKLLVTIRSVKIACYKYYERYFEDETIFSENQVGYEEVKEKFKQVAGKSDEFWTTKTIESDCLVDFSHLEQGTKDKNFDEIVALLWGRHGEKNVVKAYRLLQPLEIDKSSFNFKDKTNYNKALLLIQVSIARSQASYKVWYKKRKKEWNKKIRIWEDGWENDIQKEARSKIEQNMDGDIDPSIWNSVWEDYRGEVNQEKSSFSQDIKEKFSKINDELKQYIDDAEEGLKKEQLLNEVVNEIRAPLRQYKSRCKEEKNKLAQKIADEYLKRLQEKQEAERKEREEAERIEQEKAQFEAKRRADKEYYIRLIEEQIRALKLEQNKLKKEAHWMHNWEILGQLGISEMQIVILQDCLRYFNGELPDIDLTEKYADEYRWVCEFVSRGKDDVAGYLTRVTVNELTNGWLQGIYNRYALYGYTQKKDDEIWDFYREKPERGAMKTLDEKFIYDKFNVLFKASIPPHKVKYCRWIFDEVISQCNTCRIQHLNELRAAFLEKIQKNVKYNENELLKLLESLWNIEIKLINEVISQKLDDLLDVNLKYLWENAEKIYKNGENLGSYSEKLKQKILKEINQFIQDLMPKSFLRLSKKYNLLLKWIGFVDSVPLEFRETCKKQIEVAWNVFLNVTYSHYEVQQELNQWEDCLENDEKGFCLPEEREKAVNLQRYIDIVEGSISLVKEAGLYNVNEESRRKILKTQIDFLATFAEHYLVGLKNRGVLNRMDETSQGIFENFVFQVELWVQSLRNFANDVEGEGFTFENLKTFISKGPQDIQENFLFQKQIEAIELTCKINVRPVNVQPGLVYGGSRKTDRQDNVIFPGGMNWQSGMDQQEESKRRKGKVSKSQTWSDPVHEESGNLIKYKPKIRNEDEPRRRISKDRGVKSKEKDRFLDFASKKEKKDEKSKNIINIEKDVPMKSYSRKNCRTLEFSFKSNY